MSEATVPPQSASTPIAVWAVLGVALLLVQAVIRLTLIAIDPFVTGRGLSPLEWGACAAWTVVSLYSEGYRGFQKAFVPRVVARSFHLAAQPRPLYVVFAPAFAMALFHARPKRLFVSWMVVFLVVLAVIGVRHLPVPWRSIVDIGVVAGLVWGLASLLMTFARALRGNVPDYALDLPT